HRQRDTGVTAGGFHDGPARFERAGGLRRVDDRHTDTVLDAVGRVVELQLGQHLGVETLGEAIEPDQWCASDDFGDVVVDIAHFRPLWWTQIAPTERSDRWC